MSWFRMLVQRQNAHSWYVSFAALLMSLTLVVDLLFHHYMAHRWFIWTLLVVSLAGGIGALLSGARIPRWIGVVAVCVFFVAQGYFLSLRDDPQSVISSVQQFPIVAFYLGWFVRPKVAVPLALLGLVGFAIVMFSNPLFGANGSIGAPVAVHALLGLIFCYGAGLYLWRREVRIESADPLTGALTRARFQERAAHRIERARAPLSLVAIDFDDFKSLNDTHGHAAGDVALETTIGVWFEEVRVGDVIGRIGGDEFALLLPATDAATAAGIAERLLTVSPHSWSWGVAELQVGDDTASLWRRADAALYEQKREKRQAHYG